MLAMIAILAIVGNDNQTGSSRLAMLAKMGVKGLS